MGRIGTFEIVLIILVVVLLFGAKRIPELMRSLGSGVREFKKGARGETDDETRPAKPTDSEKSGGEKKP
jgi:sec-independent protein translocase protein TatA